MKKHNTLKVVILSILLFVLLTWLLPTASYSSGLTESARVQLGLFDLFSYPLIALSYFGYAFIYVLLVGALYGVLNNVPAYKAMLEKITKGFKGKEWLFLTISMVVIAVLTSVTGLSFGLLVVFPMIIAIILMMGYNKLVAASTTVGSVIAGLMGTTLGYSSVYYINYILNTEVFDLVIAKIIILVLSLGLLIFNVLKYAKKTKNDKIEDDYNLVPETLKVKKDKKIRIWPLALVFDLMLIFLLLGSVSWSSAFKITLFDDITTWFTEFNIAGFPIFSKIFGTVSSFGNWSFNIEIPFMLIITTIIIGLVYRIKPSDFCENVIDGVKRAFYPAVVVLFVFVLLIIATYHPFQLVIVKALLGLTKGLNVVTMTVVALLSSLFNVDAIYVGQSTLPYVTSIITDSSLYPLIEVIFQSVYGLAMLILPSSVILMATLAYMDIPYKQWLKHIWKLFLEMLIVLLIIFIVLLII